MATYQYRCEVDGDFTVQLPMGQAQPRCPCPACGESARRAGGRHVPACVAATDAASA